MLQIFRALASGIDTFSGLQKGIDGINSRILSERLVELENIGIVERKIVSERPIKIKYVPTQRCFDLVREFDRIDTLVRSWK